MCSHRDYDITVLDSFPGIYRADERSSGVQVIDDRVDHELRQTGIIGGFAERVEIIGELLTDRSYGVEIRISTDSINLTIYVSGGHSLGRGVVDRHDGDIHIGIIEKS